MKDLSCVAGCTLFSLKELIRAHFHMVLVALVVGAFLGAVFGGLTEALVGAGVGVLLAIAYGCIPRTTDCIGECPLH
ncbi:MAG: hypothetical protein AB9873_05360 [Syntrophobacteraceae bacterium]